MKMKSLYRFLIAIPLAAAIFSCQKKEIVFDHEKQAFDIQDGKILIEAIVPSSTALDDEIYLVGPAAGGDSLAVWGDTKWRLTRSQDIAIKWGLYIDPADFHGGKTLADGFSFVSLKDGIEMTALGEVASHTLDAQTGKSYNVYVSAWRSRFASSGGDEPEDSETLPEHDGVRVYIIDNTGWAAIALYQWGGVNDFGGGWPGVQVAGTVTLGGTEYKYFEYGNDIFGLSQHLIFNNNNDGKQLPDYDVTFAEGVVDYFLEVTATGVTPIDNPFEGGTDQPSDEPSEEPGEESEDPGEESKDPGEEPTGEPSTLFVKNGMGWGENLRLYAWGVNLPELFGNWPGSASSSATSLSGETWEVFPIEASFSGSTYNLIPNNKVAEVPEADQVQYDGPAIEIGGLMFVDLTATAASVVDAPKLRIYIDDKSGWGENLRLYAWGDNIPELFGNWPGAAATISGGETYFEVDITEHYGQTYHLIFNNKVAAVPEADQVQYDGPVIALTGDYSLEVTATQATEL